MKHVVLDIFYPGLCNKACHDSGFTNLSFYWGAISTIGSAHVYYKLFRAVCAESSEEKSLNKLASVFSIFTVEKQSRTGHKE